MRLIGLKSAMLAAGLMLAGAGHAAPQAAPADHAAAPRAAIIAPVPAATPAATTPAPAATPAASDPEMLAMDGAPAMVPVKGIGDAVDGDIGIQPQVTKNGERARGFHDDILVPVIVVISVFVLFLLLWVVFRYRASANPVPSKTTHNTATRSGLDAGPGADPGAAGDPVDRAAVGAVQAARPRTRSR